MGKLSRRKFLKLGAGGVAAAAAGYLAIDRLLLDDKPPNGKVPTPPAEAHGTETPPPSDEPAYEVIDVAGGGAVSGVVRFQGKPPALEQVEADTRYPCCDPHQKENVSLVLGKNNEVRHAVVYIEGIRRGKALPEGPTVLADQQCMFEPHVVWMPLGGALRYRNRDDIPHSFVLSSEITGRLGGPELQPDEVYDVPADSLPRRAHGKVIPVKSDTHWWEWGYLFVHDSPYCAVTDKQGRYLIDGVPPGRHTLRVWHENIVVPREKRGRRILHRVVDTRHPDGVQVLVPAGGVRRMDFILQLAKRKGVTRPGRPGRRGRGAR